MADIVVNLRDERPVWSLPDWAVAELRAALPTDWIPYVELRSTSGAGDGSGALDAELLREVAGARVYLGFGIPAEVLEAGADTLDWVHSGAAGVGGSLGDAMRKSAVRFTNSAGIHGPPIAETVVGMLLYFARGLDFAVAAQREGRWNDDPFLEAGSPVRELASMRVGILGYGGIGREVGRRLRSMGCEVLGLRRSGAAGTDGRGPVDELGVTVVHGDAGLDGLISSSDALILTVPDTPATRGILSADRIRALTRGAVVINVGRGRLVDEDALVEALRDGHLRGAGLDVFTQEPLPVESAFWGLPNVLVTPHTSAVTRGYWRREIDLIVENLSRFLNGEPLRNQVDPDLGY